VHEGNREPDPPESGLAFCLLASTDVSPPHPTNAVAPIDATISGRRSIDCDISMYPGSGLVMSGSVHLDQA